MMKVLLILLFSLCLVNCKPASVAVIDEPTQELKTIVLPEIPDIEIDKSDLNYSTGTSKWTYDGKLFSGICLSYYPDGSLEEKFGVLNGKKQNTASQWFPDGHLKTQCGYHEGRLHGEKKAWSVAAGHTLLSQLNYYGGKVHGEQKKWYVSGELFKVLHLNMGQEEGMQRAYRKNGDLFANYEARSGRTFGLKKAALCYGLEDEKIQYDLK